MAQYLRQKLADLDPPFPVHIIPYDVDPNESQADSEETSSIPEEMDLDVPEVELLCNGEVNEIDMSNLFLHSESCFTLGRPLLDESVCCS